MSNLNAKTRLIIKVSGAMSNRKAHISHLLRIRQIFSICLVMIIAYFFIVGQVEAAGIIVRVGVYQNKPKLFTDEKGEPSGFFIELLKQIALQEGWSIHYISGEWETCLRALEAGEIDLMPDVAHTPMCDEKFDFNKTPVIVSWSRVYASRTTPIKQLSDLDSKRIAVLQGSIQEEVFKQALSELGYNVILIPANSFENAFALTAKHSADVAITNNFFGDYFYRKYHLKKTNINFNRVELFFATAKGKNSELLEAVDRNLVKWINQPNSPYYQAAERWTEKPYSQTKFTVRVICAVVGLLSLLFGIICLLRYQVRTRSKRLEKSNLALRQSKERYRLISEIISDYAYAYRVEPDKILVREWIVGGFQQITGYTSQEIDEHGGLFSLVYPDDVPIAQAHKSRLFAEQDDVSEFRIVRKNGEIRWLCNHAHPIWDEKLQRVVQIYGAAQDVTERKLVEKSLQKRYKELTAIYETSQRLQQLLPPDQLAQKILETLEHSLDYTYSEVLLIDEKSGRLEPFAISDQNKGEKFVKKNKRQLRSKDSSLRAGITGWAAEHRESVRVGDVAKDPRYLKIRQDVRSELCVPLQIQNRVVGVVNIESNEVDIYTEDDQRMLESIAAQISVALQNMQLLDEVRKNTALLEERITELKLAQEELRRSHEQYERFYMQDLTGDFTATPDGKLIDCNPAFLNIFGFSSKAEALQTNSITLFHSPEERQRLISRLQQEHRVEYYEMEMKKRDGSPLYIIANILGRFNKRDKLIEIQGYLFDDTKRKITEEQLRHAQKFESLGALASGIAHDFNNILAIIMGHASLIKLIKNAPPKLAKHVDAISDATSRGASLVNQMLTFARKTGTIQEPLNLNLLVKDMSKMIYETFPRTIQLRMNIGRNLAYIIVDISQMNQVLMNLCVNARDAMPNGGTLTISTSNINGEEVNLKFPKASAQNYVLLSIADTGVGMDRPTRERIFEPFFTTKVAGKGTGLGLAVVHGIVTAHDGFIELESKPGEGTTFYIYLPAQEKLAEIELPEKPSDEDIPKGNETILVVEDEEMLQGFLRQLLEKNGYTVLTAGNGEQAIDIYQQQMKEIALILMDLGLPKLSGDEVYRRIKALDPMANVIIASGYLDPMIKMELSQVGVREYIQKPYSPIEILKKIREVIDSQGSVAKPVQV
jgi:two-component system cell cycle sensor histidine kinase/response regulator CckA